MPLLIAPQPLAVAIAQLSAATPIGSALKSADWAKWVPELIKRDTLFSSTVESVDFMQELKTGLLEIVSAARRGGDGSFASPQALIADLREFAVKHGLDASDPAKVGTLEDLGSMRRLELVVNHNLEKYQSLTRMAMDQDQAVLDAFPAWELIRITEPQGEKRNWRKRWSDAGGETYPGTSGYDGKPGRMIALKNDPIWSKISRFGTPFSPRDFNTGTSEADVDREEAEALGVIAPGQTVRPEAMDRYEAEVAASAEVSPERELALRTIFGNQIQVIEGRLSVRKEAA